MRDRRKQAQFRLRLPCFSDQEDVILENEGGLFFDFPEIASVWPGGRYSGVFQRSYLAVFGLTKGFPDELQVGGRGVDPGIFEEQEWVVIGNRDDIGKQPPAYPGCRERSGRDFF